MTAIENEAIVLINESADHSEPVLYLDAVDSNDPGQTSGLQGLLAPASLNFGNIPNVTIGNYVWNDANGNGVQDTGENGIPNVTLTLTGTTGSGNPVTRRPPPTPTACTSSPSRRAPTRSR